jgi:plastocyanin
MKKTPLFNSSIVLACFLALMLFGQSNAATWTVNVQNFQFVPASLNVTVGDTVKWQWINGDHTTTSMVVPGGASTWDEPITISNQTYRYRVSVAGMYTYKCTPHFPGMEGSFNASPIGIILIQGTVPDRFELHQNHPNPFNAQTKIGFDLPTTSNVKLVVSDILGREVAVLISNRLEAGRYEADWDASNVSTGIYFYTLTTGNFKKTLKLMLIK